LATLLVACKTDYQHLPAFSEQKQLQVVVLTPAGSNHPQKYDSQKKTFVSAQDAGMPEQVKFLPYPGNFGFIPSTLFKTDNAADSEPLRALVLAESMPTGTVAEVIPIGTLLLETAGEATFVVVTVPARPSEQVVAATDFATFSQSYPAAKDIIQKWFIHENPNRPTRLMGWKDEKYTEKLIRRWLL
jgi:inorganic pyrophosphatase